MSETPAKSYPKSHMIIILSLNHVNIYIDVFDVLSTIIWLNEGKPEGSASLDF